jgi:asparagine synthase (glutamine-hydrolysing)
MMMGHSVEGRFPYLDHRVAEFAMRLPDRMRLRGLREKHLLRVTARPLLPAAITNRVKHPYRAPILRSFFGETRPEYVDEMLDPAHIASTGLFRPDAVAKLVAKCKVRSARGIGESDEMALVGILSTLLLHERMVTRPHLAPFRLPTRAIVKQQGSDLSAPAVRGA